MPIDLNGPTDLNQLVTRTEALTIGEDNNALSRGEVVTTYSGRTLAGVLILGSAALALGPFAGAKVAAAGVGKMAAGFANIGTTAAVILAGDKLAPSLDTIQNHNMEILNYAVVNPTSAGDDGEFSPEDFAAIADKLNIPYVLNGVSSEDTIFESN